MEATHEHAAHQHGEHAHAEHHHEPEPAPRRRRRENWNDDDYVLDWIARQDDRAEERHREFVLIRAMIPKTREQEFRYLNLGAGNGLLDEVLLEHFPGAEGTLVDGSLAMLGAARERLERFGDRVEYVQGNFTTSDWAGALSGPFDVAVSTIALHNLRDAVAIREVYAQTYKLLGHGGLFLNLDYIRPARPELSGLARWGAKDPEAKLMGRGGGQNLPGTLQEHLAWLNEAGFACADCFWREFQVALIGGVRDHLHLPEEEHAHGADAHHAH